MLFFNVEIFISLDLSHLFIFISEFELKLQKKIISFRIATKAAMFSDFYFKLFSVIFVLGASVLSTIEEIFSMQIKYVYCVVVIFYIVRFTLIYFNHLVLSSSIFIS